MTAFINSAKMMGARSKNYEDTLKVALLDPVEASAYLEAVLEIDDPAALLLALRQIACHPTLNAPPPT